MLPRTVFAGKGSAGVPRVAVRICTASPNRFPPKQPLMGFDIHPQYSVGLLVADRGGDPSEIEVAGMAESAAAFAAQVVSPGRRCAGRRSAPPLNYRCCPPRTTPTCLPSSDRPAVSSRQWALALLPSQGIRRDQRSRRFGRARRTGWPLWKGASFDQFNPHGAGARACPSSDAALAKARKPRPRWRLAGRRGRRGHPAGGSGRANGAARPGRLPRHREPTEQPHGHRLPRAAPALPGELSSVPLFPRRRRPSGGGGLSRRAEQSYLRLASAAIRRTAPQLFHP